MAENLIREIHTQLDLITNDLAALPREDRIAWFRRTTYVQPLHFLKEINGTIYAVRAFFDDEAKENIVEKVQRIILSKDSAEMGNQRIKARRRLYHCSANAVSRYCCIMYISFSVISRSAVEV